MSQAQKAETLVERATGNHIPAVLHIELEELEIINVEIDWSPLRLQRLRELRANGVPKNGYSLFSVGNG